MTKGSQKLFITGHFSKLPAPKRHHLQTISDHERQLGAFWRKSDNPESA